MAFKIKKAECQQVGWVISTEGIFKMRLSWSNRALQPSHYTQAAHKRHTAAAALRAFHQTKHACVGPFGEGERGSSEDYGMEGWLEGDGADGVFDSSDNVGSDYLP